MKSSVKNNWIKDKIDKSPIITIIVSISAILGFLISILIGIYSLNQIRQRPIIKFNSLACIKFTDDALHINELISDENCIVYSKNKVSPVKAIISDEKIQNDSIGRVKVKVATLSFAFLNPTKDDYSLYNFELSVNFENYQYVYKSVCYKIDNDSINNNNSYKVILKPGDVCVKDIKFYFIHSGNLMMNLRNNNYKITITCQDQNIDFYKSTQNVEIKYDNINQLK